MAASIRAFARRVLPIFKKEVHIMAETFIRGFTIDWGKVEEDSYLREIPALRTLSGLDFHRNVTMLVGENGSGKSTLLEALATAYGFNAEGGTINFHFSTYDDVSVLGNAVRLIRNARKKPSAGYFFRAESFFNVATAIMEKYNDDGKLVRYSLRNTLKGIEDNCAANGIVRCDRSFLVNLKKIRIIRHTPQGVFAEMDFPGVENIPVSKTYASELLRLFGN